MKSLLFSFIYGTFRINLIKSKPILWQARYNLLSNFFMYFALWGFGIYYTLLFVFLFVFIKQTKQLLDYSNIHIFSRMTKVCVGIFIVSFLICLISEKYHLRIQLGERSILVATLYILSCFLHSFFKFWEIKEKEKVTQELFCVLTIPPNKLNIASIFTSDFHKLYHTLLIYFLSNWLEQFSLEHIDKRIFIFPIIVFLMNFSLILELCLDIEIKNHEDSNILIFIVSICVTFLFSAVVFDLFPLSIFTLINMILFFGSAILIEVSIKSDEMVEMDLSGRQSLLSNNPQVELATSFKDSKN